MDQPPTINKSLYFVLVLLALFVLGARVQTDVTLRVGVYANPPLLFMDENGQASGLVIDMLVYVARQEDWQLEYVACAWAQCLDQLETGDIDLLGAIAFSKERSRRFDFTNEALITNWGQVYTRPDAQIESLLDLNGKTLVVLHNDIYSTAIQELLRSFDVAVSLVEVNDYASVLALLQDGGADAGVMNRLFASQFAAGYNIHETAIVFHPIEVRYAVSKGVHEDVLAALDSHLQRLKADKNSAYYQSLDKWFGGAGRWHLPVWLLWTGGIVVALLLTFLIASLWLRVRVQARTSELRAEIGRRARTEQALQAKTRQQQSLIEAARHLTESLAVDAVLQRIAQQAKNILDAYGCAIYLLEEDGSTLTPAVAIEPDIKEQILATPLHVDASLTGQAVRARRGLIFNQPSAQENINHISDKPMYEQERVLVAPLVIEDQVLGAMCLNRIGPNFAEDDLALAEIYAAYAVIALKNARLYERVIHDAEEMEKRVHERTEELQDFVNLTAGRELRMAELKQAIRQLRQQLQDAGMKPTADDPLAGATGSYCPTYTGGGQARTGRRQGECR